MTEEQASAVIGQMDRIIALLEEIRDQGKPKEGKATIPGPFMGDGSNTARDLRCEHCTRPMSNLTGQYIMTNGTLTEGVCSECHPRLIASGWRELARAK